MRKSLGRFAAFGVLALGLAAPFSMSQVVQAQSAGVEPPAFSVLADRVAVPVGDQDFDATSQGLSAPMYVDEVLPPRRPSPARIAASRERARATSGDIWIARPMEVVRPASRRNSLCASERCPNANMIGIQY